MTTIAVDAMGGDFAPRIEVEGAILAARQHGTRVILVGREDEIARELARHHPRALAIEIVHAPEVITMEDTAARAFRKKRDSSIHVATRLVRDGKADGVVSAGNTGAVMTIARFLLGSLPSVDRPALAGPFPTSRGTPVVILDIGANVDCKPLHLEQFAVMGAVYYRTIFGVPHPKVGLLSIGEEEHKGNELVRETHARLKHLPVNFVGNVEGPDVYHGRVHVVVCDGFIGNVVLKISEGLVEAVTHLLKEALSSTLTSKVGYVLSRRAFADFKKRLDYSEHGGALLLGIKGTCVISHGRSNVNAIKNAVRVAAEFSQGRINEKIEKELESLAVESR